jgi:hypothetical protein
MVALFSVRNAEHAIIIFSIHKLINGTVCNPNPFRARMEKRAWFPFFHTSQMHQFMSIKTIELCQNDPTNTLHH